MTATETHRLEVKKMLVSQLRLRMDPADITDDMPFFGEGLGLDSVDAIELVAAVEEAFGVVLSNEDEAKTVLVNVSTLTDYIVAQGGLK